MKMKEILQRLLCCLIGWGTVGVVYSYTGQASPTADLLTPGFIDNLFYFSVNAIWFYLSFFIFIPLGYLLCQSENIRPLMVAMQLCALISGCVYLLFPTTMVYANFADVSLASRVLSALIGIDSPQNLLPSLHVSLTLVVLVALWSKQQKYRTAFYLLWAIAICLSVLVLKRHLFIDVVTGAVTAFSALWIVRIAQYRLWRKSS